MRNHAWIALIAGLLIAADASPDAAIQEDLKQLAGTWKLVSATRDGVALPTAEVKQTNITFQTDRFEFPDASVIGTSQKGTLRLDPAKSPKTMDAIADGDAKKPIVSLGIYTIDGDHYRVCFAEPGKPRPTEFRAPAGSGLNLQIWKRAKMKP